MGIMNEQYFMDEMQAHDGMGGRYYTLFAVWEDGRFTTFRSNDTLELRKQIELSGFPLAADWHWATEPQYDFEVYEYATGDEEYHFIDGEYTLGEAMEIAIKKQVPDGWFIRVERIDTDIRGDYVYERWG